MDKTKAKNRGPAPLPPSQKRGHCVSVRLNPDELSWLDQYRGKFQRGEFLRMAAVGKLPPTIPAMNAQAYAELARSAANLNQLARYLNSGNSVATETIVAELNEFRRALIGVKQP